MNRTRFSTFVAAWMTALCVTLPAFAAEGDLVVELNKFEPAENQACQAFFLFRNNTGDTFEGFEMSLAILDQNGVIDRLLTIDAAPLNATRTALKLFEIPEIECQNVSEILVHDIGSCRPQNGEEMDCFPLIKLISKTDAKLVF